MNAYILGAMMACAVVFAVVYVTTLASLGYILAAAIACAVAYTVVYMATPPLIRYLTGRNSTVPDVHRKGKVMIPRPGGPAILAGIIAAEAILYVMLTHTAILAVMAVSLIGFAVGFVDDKKVMGGWFKPLALVAAAVPIILLGTYGTDLAFPIFGEVHIPLLYLVILILMVPITGNTVNSIDILNGVASGVMAIAGAALTVCLFIVGRYDIAAASLPLVFVSLAFFKYHKIPSRIFPGDSGALTLGAMYGALAIVGQVEVVAAIIILPLIVNSFLFLASVKKIVEHRAIRVQPVITNDELKMKASGDRRAPMTLLRILTSKKSLTEGEAAREIFKLVAFSGSLGIVSAFLMVLMI